MSRLMGPASHTMLSAVIYVEVELSHSHTVAPARCTFQASPLVAVEIGPQGPPQTDAKTAQIE